MGLEKADEYRFPLDPEANEMLHALCIPERIMGETVRIPLSFSFKNLVPVGIKVVPLEYQLAGAYSQARVRENFVDLSFPRRIVNTRDGDRLVSLTFEHDSEQGALVAAGHVIELDLAEEATITWLSERSTNSELSTAH